MNREWSIEDLIFEYECVSFFKKMEKKNKHSRIGFLFKGMYDDYNSVLHKMLKIHNKTYNDKLRISDIKYLIGG